MADRLAELPRRSSSVSSQGANQKNSHAYNRQEFSWEVPTRLILTVANKHFSKQAKNE
jgi:hypothetical protein